MPLLVERIGDSNDVGIYYNSLLQRQKKYTAPYVFLELD